MMSLRSFFHCIRRCGCAAGILLLMVAAPAQSKAPDHGDAPIWLVMGDSISAAYGIAASQGWVALLQQRLQARGYRAQLVNASVSGETTAGGLARLPALLARHRPAVVLIELGGNDGLRALPVSKLRDNLGQMIRLAKAANAKPVLFEMQIPANYGSAYTQPFAASFAVLAKQENVPLAPFLLTPIASNAEAFQADGIHPTAAVQHQLLDTVWPTLEPLARR